MAGWEWPQDTKRRKRVGSQESVLIAIATPILLVSG